MPDASLRPTPSSLEEVKTRHQQRQELLRRLDSTMKNIRIKTIDECRDLSAFEIRALLRMADETRNPSLPQRTQRRMGIIILLGVIFLFSLNLYFKSLTAFATSSCFIYALALTFIQFSSKQQVYSVRLQDSLAVIISNAQDPALLPEALRILYVSWRPGHEHTRLERALYARAAHFLLTLDIGQIRGYNIQQQAFYIYLSSAGVWSSPEISIRVLNILEQIATPTAIPTVTQITRYVLVRPSETQKQVRAAAQLCLHVLQQRARENSQPQTLLRASAAPATDPDFLLRPADAQVSQSEPDRLLRPANMM